MAEDNKIYPPSDYKLEKARERGDVFKSNELTQAALFLMIWALLSFGGEAFFQQSRALLTQFLTPANLTGTLSEEQLLLHSLAAWQQVLWLTVPLMAALVLVALGVLLAQVRPLFTMQKIAPKFENLNPFAGAKKIFLTGRTYRDFFLNLIKFSVVLFIVYLNGKGALRDITLAARGDVLSAAQVTAAILSRLLLQVGLWFALSGAADFLLRRQDYLKEQNMSREEVEKEAKELDQSPEVKQMIREARESLLQEGGVEQVAEAAFVAVNPTHLAVAIRCKKDADGYENPKVIAKGRGLMARRILREARRHNLTIERNKPLTRSLFMVPLGREIPEDLLRAVAVIIARLEREQRKRELLKQLQLEP